MKVSSDPLAELTPADLDALSAFRASYEAMTGKEGCLPSKPAPEASVTSVNVDNEDDEGSNGNDRNTPLQTLLPAEPVFVVDSAVLPPSGHRPLDDLTLWRFLAADKRKNKFRPKLSLTRLNNALSWRKELQVDDLLRHPPPDHELCSRLRVRRWVGLDRQRRPVMFERLGQFFSRGNGRRMTLERWIVNYAYDLENHFVQMREATMASDGKPVFRYVYCADMAGVFSKGMTEVVKTVPLVQKLTKAVEEHYPEIVDLILLFNAPKALATVFNRIFVRIMDPMTAAKVHIQAGTAEEKLLELMPKEVIPIEYGGLNAVEYPETATQ